MVAMSLAEVLSLPAVMSIERAGRALGIGRTQAYKLAKASEFPVLVHRVGARTTFRDLEVGDRRGGGSD
jgi:hypothetical protein